MVPFHDRTPNAEHSQDTQASEVSGETLLTTLGPVQENLLDEARLSSLTWVDIIDTSLAAHEAFHNVGDHV